VSIEEGNEDDRLPLTDETGCTFAYRRIG